MDDAEDRDGSSTPTERSVSDAEESDASSLEHRVEDPSSSTPSSSTAGLAELNTWLWDSCELGVAAWMRAPTTLKAANHQRCCFTADTERCRPLRAVEADVWQNVPCASLAICVSATSNRRSRTTTTTTTTRRGNHHHHHHHHHHRRGGRRRGKAPGQQQQLWCVTPFEAGRVRASKWSTIETALTPRLCPRVFSREFPGGVIVGASLGSIRVVRSTVTGWRSPEFLLMISVGDKCRRAWKAEADLGKHARMHWAKWSPSCRAAWAVAEADRSYWSRVDDYPYIAKRHAAFEAVLREILFSAESPAEIVLLGGSDDIGPPPSLAEVMRRDPSRSPSIQQQQQESSDDTAAVPAMSDEDYAALFGGRLEQAPPTNLDILFACANNRCGDIDDSSPVLSALATSSRSSSSSSSSRRRRTERRDDDEADSSGSSSSPSGDRVRGSRRKKPQILPWQREVTTSTDSDGDSSPKQPRRPPVSVPAAVLDETGCCGGARKDEVVEPRNPVTTDVPTVRSSVFRRREPPTSPERQVEEPGCWFWRTLFTSAVEIEATTRGDCTRPAASAEWEPPCVERRRNPPAKARRVQQPGLVAPLALALKRSSSSGDAATLSRSRRSSKKTEQHPLFGPAKQQQQHKIFHHRQQPHYLSSPDSSTTRLIIA